MIIKNLIAVFSIFLMLVTIANAAECPSYSRPTVYMPDRYTVTGPSQTMSADGLQQMRETQFGLPTFGKTIVMGVTQQRLTGANNYDFKVESVDDQGNFCVGITQINIDVGIDSEVFLNPDYPPGTCRYDVTNEHEQKHVELTKEIYKEYRKKLKETAEAYAKTIGNNVMPHAEIEPYQIKLNEGLIEKLKPIAIDMQKEMVIQNSELDSRKEYVRLTEACPAE